jgi:hypothetical protein
MTQPGEWRPRGGVDAPVDDPSGDLLDVDEEARGLARYIEEKVTRLPFTLGIFGEWGEGKTTLVRLLRYHLSRPEGGPEREVDFVNFSAWPYNTSEKLWRALIIEIARTLYGPRADARGGGEGGEGARPRKGLRGGALGAVSDFLAGEVVLRERAPSRYETFLRRLDRADYGAVARRGGEEQADEGATMAAFVKGAVTALSTVSPLAAGLRAFFGFEAKDDIAKIVRQNNEAEREGIEALANFRQIFEDMIEGRPEARKSAGPVYVFIDDLDRAQPGVALDIMESVSVALGGVECVFIVAVDKRLIDEGLRLRYPKLFADDKGAGLSGKGGQYLEKIIQFRTRVPPRRPEQVQGLIAAEYPEWAAVGDIIRLVAGTNPRRVKQYCERLSFQQMTGRGLFALSRDAAAPPAAASRAPDAAAPPPEVKRADLARLLNKLGDETLRQLSLNRGHRFGADGGSFTDKVEALVLSQSDEGIRSLVGELRSTHPRLLEELERPPQGSDEREDEATLS